MKTINTDNAEPGSAYSDKELYGVLEHILTENGVPAYSYSLGEPAEGCVCLEHRNDWLVYEVFRDHALHVRRFDTFSQACRDFFRSIVIGKERIMALEENLEKALSKDDVREEAAALMTKRSYRK